MIYTILRVPNCLSYIKNVLTLLHLDGAALFCVLLSTEPLLACYEPAAIHTVPGGVHLVFVITPPMTGAGTIQEALAYVALLRSHLLPPPAASLT